jgi:hypothetical protein
LIITILRFIWLTPLVYKIVFIAILILVLAAQNSHILFIICILWELIWSEGCSLSWWTFIEILMFFCKTICFIQDISCFLIWFSSLYFLWLLFKLFIKLGNLFFLLWIYSSRRIMNFREIILFLNFINKFFFLCVFLWSWCKL